MNYISQYPVGVPTTIVSREIDVNWSSPEDIKHIGLYKVRIIPPKKLFIPVVPVRLCRDDPRLLFPLCLKCANTNKDKCHHTDAERGWTCTLTSIELKEALMQGYTITRCYRIWSYSRTENLFKEYVKAFMKIKVEASGFPPGIETDEDKKKWAKEYRDRLEIDIDINNVKLNPGLRYMAKYN